MTSVVILTSDELRHDFVRMALALGGGIEVLRSYCEESSAGLAATLADREHVDPVEREHLRARSSSEQDFFGAFCALAPDNSRPTRIPRGAINSDGMVEQIIGLAPDVIAAFGCSIIAEPLIDAFPGRILNLHLGLSPYYRGSGTNFWPLVNGEPELVGATFMYMDAGIDTGEIIHQVRARIVPGDDAHRIGNRLIADAAAVYRDVVTDIGRLGHVEQPPAPDTTRSYRRADADAAAVHRMLENFADGMVDDRLAHEHERNRRTPIVQNPLLTGPPA